LNRWPPGAGATGGLATARPLFVGDGREHEHGSDPRALRPPPLPWEREAAAP
jgi:hypothetical protein